MKLTSRILLIGACLLAPNISNADEKPPSEGMKIEQRALAARMKLRSGRIKLHVKTTMGPHKQPPGAATDCTLEFEFDADKLRVRKVDQRYDRAEIAIFDGTVYIQDPAERNPDRHKYVAITSARLVDRQHAPDDLFHPRMIGAYPAPATLLDQCSLEDALAVTGRSAEKVKPETLDGHTVRHISYKRANGVLIDLWVAPGMDDAVIKIQASSEGTSESVQSRYKRYGTGLWYPTRVVHRKFVKGRQVEEEVVEIKSAELNVPIDAARFTLASLPLKLGETVKKDGRYLVWDGARLVDSGQVSTHPNTDQTPVSRSLLWIIVWSSLAVLAAFLACYLLWKVLHRSAP